MKFQAAKKLYKSKRFLWNDYNLYIIYNINLI